MLSKPSVPDTVEHRELYLPAAWTEDPDRLRAVGLAPDTPFATKPQLARRMLARARDARVPMAWVTGDTVHGCSRALRSWLEDEGLHHVLAVPRNEELWAGTDAGAWTRCMRPTGTGSGTGSAPAPAARGSAGMTGSAECWPSRRMPTGGTTCCFAVPARMRTTGRLRVAGLRPGDPGGRGRAPLSHRARLRDGQAGDGPG